MWKVIESKIVNIKYLIELNYSLKEGFVAIEYNLQQKRWVSMSCQDASDRK